MDKIEAVPVPEGEKAKLPVRISLQLGFAEMSAAKIKTSKPGDTIALSTTFPRVLLATGGRPFAEAELVEVGDNVGLRILGLSYR